ncbi:hypothetical protein GCM10011390_10160 [Aureimonas endophytica]|uniref:Holin n=1 Tax=Aureimonas endophytica TaxID=2027858 RepID=A0A916ZFS8_9HYPH|nr:hypothetical protein [Aureimonas endophytica]GGD93351.1 hypothetical protein GCM10011390_10160 [Aureimonas endophytica]
MLDEKTWYRSKTIWGGVVALGAALAGMFGVRIDAATGGDLAAAIPDAIAALGAVVAILGRLAADRRIA